MSRPRQGEPLGEGARRCRAADRGARTNRGLTEKVRFAGIHSTGRPVGWTYQQRADNDPHESSPHSPRPPARWLGLPDGGQTGSAELYHPTDGIVFKHSLSVIEQLSEAKLIDGHFIYQVGF